MSALTSQKILYPVFCRFLTRASPTLPRPMTPTRLSLSGRLEANLRPPSDLACPRTCGDRASCRHNILARGASSVQCSGGCKHQIKIVGGIQEKKQCKAACLTTQYRIQGCVYLELARIQYSRLKQCSGSGVTFSLLNFMEHHFDSTKM